MQRERTRKKQTQHDDTDLEPRSVLDPIRNKISLHVNLFPTHAHQKPFHLIRREGSRICGLDGVAGDLSCCWDPDVSVSEAGIVGQELNIDESGLIVAHRRGHTLEVGGESPWALSSPRARIFIVYVRIRTIRTDPYRRRKIRAVESVLRSGPCQHVHTPNTPQKTYLYSMRNINDAVRLPVRRHVSTRAPHTNMGTGIGVTIDSLEFPGRG